MPHLNTAELEAGLQEILASPKNSGELSMIVRRPKTNEREVIEQATLDIKEGLIGDNWLTRGCGATADGSAHPDMQLNIMNSRVIQLIAQSQEKWPLAGDQLFVDLDLSDSNLPPGTQLNLGDARIEVTAEPHTGCRKFAARFGADAMRFVNSELGKQLNLRGINAKAIVAGQIRKGDMLSKLG